MEKKLFQTKITRLRREIRELEDVVYYNEDDESDDDEQKAFNLERRREDIVRVSVLSIHTAIEDLLGGWIACRILGVTPKELRGRRSVRTGALVRLLVNRQSIGFAQKLELALSLGLITRPTYARLQILNSLRNKCSHNWLLRKNVRSGRRPTQTKPPLLRYEGRDLHRADVMKEFLGEFGLTHVRLWLKREDG